MPYLELTNHSIYYHHSDNHDLSAPWVTLVNGYTRSSSDFRILTKKLASHGLRVLNIDNRGAGNSSTEKPFKFEDFCSDILEVWDFLEITHSHLLGISMGGAICQLLASKAPERVERIIMISTFLHPRNLREQRWGSKIDQVVEQLRDYFSNEFSQANTPLIKMMAKQIVKANSDGSFDLGANLQKKALKAFYEEDYKPSVTSPTLIIHGTADRIIPLSQGESLANHISNSNILRVEGGGHLLLAEAPKTIYDESIKFLCRDTQ